MGKRNKKSGYNNDIIRVLSEDSVIIPQGGGHDEETPLPSENNPWPGLIFFGGIILIGMLLWQHGLAWLKHLSLPFGG